MSIPFLLENVSLYSLAAASAPAKFIPHHFKRKSHNAASAVDYFCLPPGQVIEIGTRVEV